MIYILVCHLLINDSHTKSSNKEKYLIILRSSKAKFFPAYWDFPGGKLEKDEDTFAGIEREVLEETSLKVRALKVLGVYEMNVEGIPHRFTVYSSEILSGDVKLSDEHTDFRWATKEEILKLKAEPFMPMYFEENP